MPSARVTIPNELGLHARAAAKLVERANGFESEIHLSHRDKTVNGKSIMGVLMLAAAQGAELTITAEGQDEDEALAGVLALVRDGFGELS
ncbi:MAG: HPr family phosphocarrier protein [Xanthomonadales bacterium]|jgi:phosphocarrier protein|nr:HPr family phosphocarrier protein [Xanthomonadales bacterium]